MKAALIYGPRDMRVEEVETPKPGPAKSLSASGLAAFAALTCTSTNYVSTLSLAFRPALAGLWDTSSAVKSRNWEREFRA